MITVGPGVKAEDLEITRKIGDDEITIDGVTLDFILANLTKILAKIMSQNPSVTDSIN